MKRPCGKTADRACPSKRSLAKEAQKCNRCTGYLAVGPTNSHSDCNDPPTAAADLGAAPDDGPLKRVLEIDIIDTMTIHRAESNFALGIARHRQANQELQRFRRHTMSTGIDYDARAPTLFAKSAPKDNEPLTAF